MSCAPSFRPRVFVLSEIARPDGGFPARLIALVPLGVGVRVCARIVLPGLCIGFALILALLVDDHLLALAAGAEAEREDERGAREDDLAGRHDFAPAGPAFWSGFPYAVPQPQTSDPLPRLSTRWR